MHLINSYVKGQSILTFKEQGRGVRAMWGWREGMHIFVTYPVAYTGSLFDLLATYRHFEERGIRLKENIPSVCENKDMLESSCGSQVREHLHKELPEVIGHSMQTISFRARSMS